MNENTDVTVDQIDVCRELFTAVHAAKENAVARRNEMCVDVDVWLALLDAYSDVAAQWNWVDEL